MGYYKGGSALTTHEFKVSMGASSNIQVTILPIHSFSKKKYIVLIYSIQINKIKVSVYNIKITIFQILSIYSGKSLERENFTSR